MSDSLPEPIEDRAPAPVESAAEPRHEHPLVVLGIAVGLLALVGAVGFQFFLQPASVDGVALLGDRLGVTDLPLGFEVESAERLPSGEELVRLLDPDAPPPPPPPEAPPEEEGEEDPAPASDRGGRGHGGGDRGGWGKKKYDWGKVPEGEPGLPPAEITFVWYPRRTANSVFRSQFERLSFRDLREIDWDGGRTVVDSGKLPWDAYEAHFVRERIFRREDEKPRFHDVLRVNLTVGELACILFLTWPDGLPGSKAAAEEVLASLHPPVAS